MHSAANEVTTELQEAPGQAEERPESPVDGRPRSPRSRTKLALGAILLLAVGALLIFSFTGKQKFSSASGLLPANAAHGDPSHNLRLKGTTEAVNSRGILAPVLSGQQLGALIVTKLVAPGTRVQAGDFLAEFDRQAQTKDYLDKQAEYENLVAQVKEAEAKEDAARAKDETELRQAENDLKKAGIEMQKAELLSRIDLEKNQETLEEATATLAQLRETFALKRRAGRSAIRILEIQRDRTRQVMLHAQANAAKMQIRSPIDGVVVFTPIWKQGKTSEVQEGDQVRPGTAFMQVLDPSAMQVRVPVNQEDFLGLQAGQQAKVRLDAYPEMVFPAKLEQIAPVSRAGWFSSKMRTFSAVFSIQGNDPRLMPDLSAAVDVDLEETGNIRGGK